MDTQTRIEIEAAAFRRLREHLMVDRPDVANIDLMNMAGFCRNCLARWWQEAAAERGITISKDEARADYYGMDYADWQAGQTPVDPAKQVAFDQAIKAHQG
jgi:uncharacterized protein